MKGKLILTVLFSLLLVFGIVSCDNGVYPDYGDKELDKDIPPGLGRPPAIIGGGEDAFSLDNIFPKPETIDP